MNNDRNNLIEILTLSLTDKRQTVESSYFFHQIYTRLGIFESITSLIQKLYDENYVNHEGNFDGNSGLTKNITITLQGKKHLQKNLTEKVISEMETEFDNFDFIKEAIDSEFQSLNK